MAKLNRIEFQGEGWYKIQAPIDRFWQGITWKGYVHESTLHIFGADLIEYYGK